MVPILLQCKRKWTRVSATGLGVSRISPTELNPMNGYEIFEQWMGGSNDAFAPLFSLGKITADTMESVARRNYDVAGDCFDLGLSQLKVFTAGTDVAKLGAEESRLAQVFGDKFKAHADAYVRIAADAGEAYGAWTASLVETAKQSVTPKTAVKAKKG